MGLARKQVKSLSWITGYHVSSSILGLVSHFYLASPVVTIPSWLQTLLLHQSGKYWPLSSRSAYGWGKEPVRILSKTGSGKFLSRLQDLPFPHQWMTPVMPQAPLIPFQNQSLCSSSPVNTRNPPKIQFIIPSSRVVRFRFKNKRQ